MKNTLVLLPLILFLLSFNTAHPQTDFRDYKINRTDNIGAVNPESKALKNFKRSYPDVTNEKWSVDNGYSFVSFVQDNVKNKVVYRKDGQLDYALKIYNEDYLPETVRASVKSVYYDYAIGNAQELVLNNKTIYLVQLSMLGNYKTVRVSDGEMEEIQSYSTVISPCR